MGASFLAYGALSPLGMSWTLELAAVFVFSLAVAITGARLIGGFLTRRFVEKYRSAMLRRVPSNVDPEADELAPWFLPNGFVDHGAWNTVGRDGTIYGFIGARTFHHPDLAITASIHTKQATFLSDLEDGRVLLTSSVGAPPRPGVLVQGERGADATTLFDIHAEGLRRLEGLGVSAVQPEGGPIEHLLRDE